VAQAVADKLSSEKTASTAAATPAATSTADSSKAQTPSSSSSSSSASSSPAASSSSQTAATPAASASEPKEKQQQQQQQQQQQPASPQLQPGQPVSALPTNSAGLPPITIAGNVQAAQTNVGVQTPLLVTSPSSTLTNAPAASLAMPTPFTGANGVATDPKATQPQQAEKATSPATEQKVEELKKNADESMKLHDAHLQDEMFQENMIGKPAPNGEIATAANEARLNRVYSKHTVEHAAQLAPVPPSDQPENDASDAKTSAQVRFSQTDLSAIPPPPLDASRLASATASSENSESATSSARFSSEESSSSSSSATTVPYKPAVLQDVPSPSYPENEDLNALENILKDDQIKTEKMIKIRHQRDQALHNVARATMTISRLLAAIQTLHTKKVTLEQHHGKYDYELAKHRSEYRVQKTKALRAVHRATHKIHQLLFLLNHVTKRAATRDANKELQFLRYERNLAARALLQTRALFRKMIFRVRQANQKAEYAQMMAIKRARTLTKAAPPTGHTAAMLTKERKRAFDAAHRAKQIAHQSRWLIRNSLKQLLIAKRQSVRLRRMIKRLPDNESGKDETDRLRRVQRERRRVLKQVKHAVHFIKKMLVEITKGRVRESLLEGRLAKILADNAYVPPPPAVTPAPTKPPLRKFVWDQDDDDELSKDFVNLNP